MKALALAAYLFNYLWRWIQSPYYLLKFYEHFGILAFVAKQEDVDSVLRSLACRIMVILKENRVLISTDEEICDEEDINAMIMVDSLMMMAKIINVQRAFSGGITVAQWWGFETRRDLNYYCSDSSFSQNSPFLPSRN